MTLSCEAKAILLYCESLGKKDVVDEEDSHLVLSGSGMKLFSFISAIYALHCIGYRFTSVTGTSGGALVGAKLASLYDPDSSRSDRGDAIRRMIESTMGYDIEGLLDPQWFVWRVATTLSGFIKGRKIRRLINNELPLRFSDLKMPCTVAAFQVNLVDPRTRLINRGDLPSAVRASMSIPGVFTPVMRNGQLLVDGGFQMNLPLQRDGEGVVALTFGTGGNDSPQEVRNNIQLMSKLADGAIDEGVRRAIQSAPKATVIKIKSSIKSLDFFASNDDKVKAMRDGANSVVAWMNSK